MGYSDKTTDCSELGSTPFHMKGAFGKIVRPVAYTLQDLYGRVKNIFCKDCIGDIKSSARAEIENKYPEIIVPDEIKP